MKFGAVAGPEHVAVMGRVLDTYCRHTGITNKIERENVAARIIALYEIGVVCEEELLAALILPPQRGDGGPSALM